MIECYLYKKMFMVYFLFGCVGLFGYAGASLLNGAFSHCRALDVHCRVQGTGSRGQTPGHRHQGVGSRWQIPGHRPQSTRSRAQAPGHRVQRTDPKAQTPGQRAKGTESRKQTPGHRPQGTESRVGRLQQVWHTGLPAPQYVRSSWTRDWTGAPGIARQILNHCTAREAQSAYVLLFRE